MADLLGWRLLALLLVQPFFDSAHGYACKSPSGREVDWFVAYKLPDLDRKDDGTKFLYADQTTNGWVLSNASVMDRKSAIGFTVSQLFRAKRNKEEFLAAYNDENPNSGKTDSNRGHMKGLLVFDDISGFWLVHSVPKFPKTDSDEYLYPQTGRKNGQSLLCITFPSSALVEIGKQLYVSQPNIYDAQLPASFERLFPDLALAIQRKTYPNKRPPSSALELVSRAHQSFASFFKHKRYGKDLYEDLVAPTLGSSLYVETWMLGKGDLPSACEGNEQVYNILSVRPNGIGFKSTSDHSKWVVSGKSGNWVCIGDINRQESQKRRGGGTVCLQSAKIASLYRTAVDQVECCRGESQCGP